MERLKSIFYVIVFWVLAFMVTFGAQDEEKQYEEQGIEVFATITDVQAGRKGKKSYQCTYVNENGQKVEAYLILNKLGGEVGQVVQGRYLPENPNEVYCPPNKLLKYGLMIVVDGLAILLTVFLIMGMLGNNETE